MYMWLFSVHCIRKSIDCLLLASCHIDFLLLITIASLYSACVQVIIRPTIALFHSSFNYNACYVYALPALPTWKFISQSLINHKADFILKEYKGDSMCWKFICKEQSSPKRHVKYNIVLCCKMKNEETH